MSVELYVDIQKQLGDFRLNVKFNAPAGVTGLLGASGCGKTLTLKCIAGLERPDSGLIRLNGRTLFDSEKNIDLPPQQRQVGYLFQNYALFPNMTVEENILAGLHRVKDAGERRKVLGEMYGLLQLRGLEDHRSHQLSGGQAQRVALARILAARPQLLLLDEPFAALDSFLREELRPQMSELLEKLGIQTLMVTHDREEARQMCPQLRLMDGGEIIRAGAAPEVFVHPGNPAAARLTGTTGKEENRGGSGVEQILQCALTELERGKPAVLATIIAARGSTPRGVGAAMVVGERGVLAGTIGGGELEYRCLQAALTAKEPVMHFELDHTKAAAAGMVCGGNAQVLFTPLTDPATLERGLEVVRSFSPGWLMLPLDGSAPEVVVEASLSDKAEQLDWRGRPCLALPLTQPGRFFLLGGGHVALELAKFLEQLGYPYVVVDDRPEFSGRDRFTGARQTLTAPFEKLGEVLTGPLAPSKGDGICIMTRGHLADTDALRFALSTPAGYIGVVGSRRKREKVFQTLTEEGFENVPQRVVTPIGLPIGGQSPAEVAVSIVAQLVQWRYKGTTN